MLCLIGLSSWGFYAHKKINQLAIFTLPTPMLTFYKKQAEYITEHAVDPDKRRYVNEQEAARHFIDIDLYGDDPFASIPKKWTDAANKFTEDTLYSHGIVPWQIMRSYRLLVKAFEESNPARILRYSSDLGHYIADAHVPLHTTHNYNGQFTNQIGIHAFWESRLPELFAQDYHLFVGKAAYIENPQEFAWSIVQESHQLVDSVLTLEADLNKVTPGRKKYAYERKANTIEKVYSRNYSKQYHKLLRGMVERQMKKSILTIGSFWYSAWIDAGQPDLNKLQQERQFTPSPFPDSLENKKAMGREEWK